MAQDNSSLLSVAQAHQKVGWTPMHWEVDLISFQSRIYSLAEFRTNVGTDPAIWSARVNPMKSVESAWMDQIPVLKIIFVVCLTSKPH